MLLPVICNCRRNWRQILIIHNLIQVTFFETSVAEQEPTRAFSSKLLQILESASMPPPSFLPLNLFTKVNIGPVEVELI